MKKIFVMLLVFAATVNVMATETARIQLKVKGSDNKSCSIFIIQDDAATAGASVGSAEMNMSGRPMAFYAINGTYKYEIYKTNEFGALPFGLMTNAATSYTLSVVSASGETFTMFDASDGSTLELTAGASKTFTAAANSTIEDRFRLYVAPSEPGICHRYGKLQVSGSNGQTVRVLDMDGTTEKKSVAITADYQEIDLDGLAAGQYKVEWNGQTLIINK